MIDTKTEKFYSPTNIAIVKENDDAVKQDELFTRIAKRHCDFETLETRKRDCLDFHEVSVWGLKAALEEAFNAGIDYQIAQTRGADRMSEVVAPERITADAGEKTSVLNQIRQGAKDAQGHQPVSKEKPSHNKSNLER